MGLSRRAPPRRGYAALCFGISFLVVAVSMWTLEVDVLVKEYGMRRSVSSPAYNETPRFPSYVDTPDETTNVDLFVDQPPFPVPIADADDLAFATWFLHAEVEQILGTILQKVILEDWQPSSSSVIDAGMNRGYFTLLAARLGYDVVSFELSQGCIKKALASVAALRSTAVVHIKQTGLSFEDGGFIAVDSSCYGGRQVSHSPPTKGGDVPLLSLRTALFSLHADSQRPVALLKMDIEGNEYNVLRGFGIEGLEKFKIKNLIVEASSHVWRVGLSEATSFFERIAAISSRVYCLDPNLDVEQCTFLEIVDDRLGKMFQVTSFAQALNRTFEYYANPCCGNFWFRDIGSGVI